MTTRIGVIGDTHCQTGEELPQRALDALGGCDIIVHLGDLQAAGVLDRLEVLAPVVAVPGKKDDADDRLAAGPVRSIDVDGLNVAVVRSLAEHAPGQPSDLVLHGGTHDYEIRVESGVLHVNPGSTRFFARKATVAIVEVHPPGRMTAEIIDV